MKQEILSSIKKEWSTIKKGFLITEVLLSSAIFIMIVTAFAGVYFYGQESTLSAGNHTRAVILANEGLEALRNIRDSGFANLPIGTYGLVLSGSQWTLSGSQDVSGIFTRQVIISSVDANRKNIVINVTWQQNPQSVGIVSLPTRITNWIAPVVSVSGLMVNKVVINHGLSKIASDFAPYKVGTTTVQLATTTSFGAGTYTVSETTNSNYIRTFNGDCNSSGQVTLTASSSKICTITNEEKLSFILATSTVINHGGNKVISDFAPFKVGSFTVSIGTTTAVDSGSYTVSEATSSLYTLTYSGDCFTNGTISFLSGDSKTCMLTNEEIIQGSGGSSLSGLMIYGDGTNIPKYRTYNSSTDTFTAQTSTFTATVGPTWLMRTSPTAHYALAGYYDASATLTIMCFDGATWTQEFSAQSGGIGNRHRFDIAFEKNSGDALIFYSKGSYANGKLGYRTKSGATGCGAANWSSESLFTPARTTADIMYVKMAQDTRASSNIIAATWVDINDDISTAIWNGSAWVNEPSAVSDNNVQKISASHDIEDMDLEYESLSGDFMLVWGNGTGNNGVNGVRYRTCTGGVATCTWGAVTTPPTFADDATSLDISANPNTDEMVFASIGKTGSDLQLGYWNGTAWTDTANVDITANTPFVGSKLVTTGWLTSGTSTRSIIVYSDQNDTNLSWYAGNGGTFTLQNDFTLSPSVVSPNGYMDIEQDPVSQDQLMFLTSDSANRLYAKKLTMTGTSTLTWSNSDGGAALEATLPQIISSPYSFTFWRK